MLSAFLVLHADGVQAQGRDCPVDHGACFVELPEGSFLVVFDVDDRDNDGDTDHIWHSVDGHNDFVRYHPDGSPNIHINEPNASLIYCPFPYPYDDPASVSWDECAFGGGSVIANGSLVPTTPGICGGVVKITYGSGTRLLDGEEFEFESKLAVNGQCEEVKFAIEDNMP